MCAIAVAYVGLEIRPDAHIGSYPMLRNSASGRAGNWAPGSEIGFPGRKVDLMLPGWKLGFRAGFRPDSSREGIKVNRFGSFSDCNPGEIRPGKPMSGPEASLRNLKYEES